MTNSGSPLLGGQITTPEPVECKRRDQRWCLAGGNQLRGLLGCAGGGFEALCSAADVDEEPFDRCGADDRPEIGSHVTQPGPLPKETHLPKARHQLEDVVGQTLREIEGAPRGV